MSEVQRHVLWREAYKKNRFLRHLSQPELQQRVRDVMLNMMVLTPNALIGLGSTQEPEAQHWMIRWTQVLEEMQLRYGPFPSGFTNGFIRQEPFPDFVGALGKKAAHVFASLKLDPEQTLIKYGKPQHMAALLAQGRARIQPASFFSGSHLNGAIRDDELSLSLSLVVSRGEVVSLVRNPQDVPATAGDQVLQLNYEASSDYWLYCVTQSHEPRLFVDFDASACVIIKNKKAFSDRLEHAAASKMADSTYACGKAVYVDPHQPDSADFRVQFAKHFRYTYQREYRFAWMPYEPAKALEPVDVEMGPLDDIATLVEL
jgi:hypothetical protein